MFQGRQVLVYEIKLSTFRFYEMISLFLCSSLMILFEFNQGKFELEQEEMDSRGIEPAPRERSRGEANRWCWPA